MMASRGTVVSNVVLVVLQCYFLLMNFTVELTYCHSPLGEADGFLVAETLEFAEKYNPLFLARPEWLRVATCISAYTFCFGYMTILLAAAGNAWKLLRWPIVFFVGTKFNALFFYHIMEFSSLTPPPDLKYYLATEMPYVVSLVLVLYKCTLTCQRSQRKAKTKQR